MSDERAVQEVLARYVLAVDARNADDVAQLYVEDGAEILSYNRAGVPELLATFTGAAAIKDAVANVLPAHPPLGWAHHATFDPIVAISCNIASLQAQLVVFAVRGAQRPTDGWPPGASGGQGEITPVESGYYRLSLRRTVEGWRITENRTIVDLPPAFDRLSDPATTHQGELL